MQTRIEVELVTHLKGLLEQDYECLQENRYCKPRFKDRDFPRYIVEIKEDQLVRSKLLELYMEIKPTERNVKAENIIVQKGTVISEELYHILERLHKQ